MGFKGISRLHAVNSGSATLNFNSLTETGKSRRDVYNLLTDFDVKCVLCGFENGGTLLFNSSVTVIHNISTVLYEKNLKAVIESSRCHKCHPLLPVREDADVLSHH